jgi:hypothetical protein
MTTEQSLLVTRHLQRQSVAIFPKPTCIWRSDERDRNTGALQLRLRSRRRKHLRSVNLVAGIRGSVALSSGCRWECDVGLGCT